MSGSKIKPADLYDRALRIDSLTRAALMLAHEIQELHNAGSPPIINLLEMATNDLSALAASLSQLERENERA